MASLTIVTIKLSFTIVYKKSLTKSKTERDHRNINIFQAEYI